MSIHDFHSKLMSGNEEGTLFEALRKLRSIGGLSIWKSEGSAEQGWSMWQEEEVPEGGRFLSEGASGWVVWQEDGSGLPNEA